MRLQEFVGRVNGFHALSHPEKIKHFAWWLHAHENRERFDVTAIRLCYRTMHMQPSANPRQDLVRLEARRPREILRDGAGYKLEARVRNGFDSQFGTHETVISVSKLLSDLPGKVSNVAQRRFLSEALLCYTHGAFRAATVMTWNLAFDHLLSWILADSARLRDFNAAIAKRYPQDKRKLNLSVAQREDFPELKEFEIIEVCRKASLISDDLKKVLHEKLVRRNIAAHPSLVEITRHQADDAISDLVTNVVLALT
jgi:hypothetical protein